MDKKTQQRITRDLAFLSHDARVSAILAFGSVVREQNHQYSDIDIALIIPKLSHFYYDNQGRSLSPVNTVDLLRMVFRSLPSKKERYDVHIFEELPLYIQMEIIHHHIIIYASQKYSLSEYFYHYRKLWDEQKHRNTCTKNYLLSCL